MRTVVAALLAALSWPLQRRRAVARSRSERRLLNWRAAPVQRAVTTAPPERGADLDAILSAKLAKLDSAKVDLDNRPATDLAVVAAARSLSRSYELLGRLVRAADRAESARTWPHPALDELLAGAAESARPEAAAPDPPAPRHLTRLANACRRLDAARPDLLARIEAAPPPDLLARIEAAPLPDGETQVGEIETAVDELCERYGRLADDCRRAWNRMFPEQAVELRARGEAALAELDGALALRRQVDETVRQRERERHRSERSDNDDGPDLPIHWFD